MIEGQIHLGAVIGTNEFREEYINEKIDKWCKEIERLTIFAETQPQAAFAAYIHGE